MTVDTATMRRQASPVCDCNECVIWRSAADELRAEHDLTKQQVAELHQQLTLAEVARDASREAYDAECAAHEQTKRALYEARLRNDELLFSVHSPVTMTQENEQLRARLHSAEDSLRSAQRQIVAYFDQFTPGGGM